jgi:hypothetical protein
MVAMATPIEIKAQYTQCAKIVSLFFDYPERLRVRHWG